VVSGITCECARDQHRRHSAAPIGFPHLDMRDDATLVDTAHLLLDTRDGPVLDV
jgi:hypothetical protein